VKRLRPVGAQDDPTDAQLALELPRKHRDKLRPWRPADPQTRTLQLLVEQRWKLIDDQTRLLNRLTSPFKGYFPLILTSLKLEISGRAAAQPGPSATIHDQAMEPFIAGAEPMTTVTVQIPERQKFALRQAALDEHTTVKALLIKIIEAHLVTSK
jgi:Transposase